MLNHLRALFAASMIPAMTLPAMAADLNFCWLGGGGYTMIGQMRVPDSKMTNAIITEADVTQFKITGFQNGARIGSWNMSQRQPDTTWHLRFDPVGMKFLTGGAFASTRSQGWNADGDVTNCGNPGFGFNSGNYAQDVCVNGAYIVQSSIHPETPLIVTFGPVTATCDQRIPLGKAQIANQPLDAESLLP